MHFLSSSIDRSNNSFCRSSLRLKVKRIEMIELAKDSHDSPWMHGITSLCGFLFTFINETFCQKRKDDGKLDCSVHLVGRHSPLFCFCMLYCYCSSIVNIASPLCCATILLSLQLGFSLLLACIERRRSSCDVN